MYANPWQADCIDMDCDGPRQALIGDEDGTLLDTAGSVLPRADSFSEGSFFGLPFKDEVNRAYMQTFVPSWVNWRASQQQQQRGRLGQHMVSECASRNEG
jgi:hypothetical protein